MTPSQDLRKTTLSRLKGIAEEIAAAAEPLSERARSNFRKKLEEGVWEVKESIEALDPVLRPARLFDPSDPETAASTIALTLVAQKKRNLADLFPFYGSGVYAIYYTGDFPPYSLLAEAEHPIYLGKADPDTPLATDAVQQGKRLYDRLSEHADSIRDATSTLSIADFQYRAMVVKSGYQQAAEARLIAFFKPIWNKEVKICQGIGKHGDSPETRKNMRSPWDAMHPGRSWAEEALGNQKEPSAIIEEIADHLATFPPSKSSDEFMHALVEDLRQIADPLMIDRL